MERWQFFTVLCNRGRSVSSRWTWRTVNEDGETIRQSGRHFGRLEQCVNDAVEHGYALPHLGSDAHPIMPTPLA